MLRRIVPLILMLTVALTPGAQAAEGKNDGLEASKQERTSGPSGKLNFQTDLFTGRFGYSVPILLAPGRHGSEPQLAVRYNSTGENSWCGWGWELELGYIQRETRKGVPVKWGSINPLKQYDDTKGFIFSLGGQGASLVNVNGANYQAEVDSAFLRFSYVTNTAGTTNYWLVTDKGGNKYFFGLTGNSRMANAKSGWPSNSAAGTFRWALSRIETVNGDTTSIIYTNIAGAQYPLLLSYNGHTAGMDESHTVEFQLGTRSDARISLMTGYRVDMTRRLTNIVHKIDGARVRRYQLGYITSPSTKRSLLSSVTLYGTNNTSVLPSVTFDYTAQNFGFQSAVNWTNVWLPLNSPSYGSPVNAVGPSVYADVIDMNGDGLPDRLSAATAGSLPYTNFFIQANTGAGFGPLTPWRIGSQGQPNDPNWCLINSAFTRMLDINADGFPDRVMDPFETYQTHGPLDPVYTNLVAEPNNGADFSATKRWTNVVPNATGAYEPLPSFLAIENPGFVKMADMNGDGLPDRVMRGWQGDLTTPYTNLWVQFNTGNGFGGTNAFGPYFSQGQSNDQVWAAVESDYIRLMDINGDGLPDRVMLRYSAYMGDASYYQTFTNFVVEFNNGYGFEPAAIWGGINPFYNPPACGTDPDPSYCGLRDSALIALRDVNGDGLPDRLVRPQCPPMTNWLVQINTGSGFASAVNFGPFQSQGQTSDPGMTAIESGAVRLMDINGDGLPDRVMAKYPVATNHFVVELSKGPMPDLLTGVDNGIDGSVFVAYKPSTQWDNRESTNSANSRRLLPFPIYTVSSVSTADGLYPSNTTSYFYEGGMWSPARREFHGFASVKVTDPLGGTTTQWFHQAGGRDNSALGEYADTTNNIGKKGQPFRVETRGTNGQLYGLVLNKVEDVPLTGGRHFPYISQSLALDYPGNTNAYRATGQQFAYDLSNGNLTNTSNLGEVGGINSANHSFTDTVSDSLHQSTAYASLANTNILDKPQRSVVSGDAAGTEVLRETLFDYDGATGNLTRQRNRICEGSFNTNGFGYDAYRNPIWSTNEAGIVTETAFDSTYQAFPQQQTVSGTFTSTELHDAKSGAVLSATDAKGLVTSNAYDVFLRLTNSWISSSANGPAEVWTARYSYNLGGISAGVAANYVRVRKNDGVDAANGHESWTYTDGLDRVLQTRIEAETNGYRVTDTVYDKRGSVRVETQPQFSSGTSYVKPSGTDACTAYYHDPIGRVTNVTACANATFTAGGLLQTVAATTGDTGSPVGPMVAAYNDGNDPWVIVRTDEEGKVRKFKLDAYGRTNQIIEITGGGNYTTTLAHDKAGLLTNLTDHANNRIEYAYNDLGQLVAMADPNLGVWQYRRDFAGRIREQIDGRSNLVVFAYESLLGRLSTKLAFYANGAFSHGVTNTYDSSDDPGFTVYPRQLYKVSDSQGSQKSSYDVRGRVLKTARYLAKNSQTYASEFVYDDADHVRTNIYVANGPTLRYTFDPGGNLSEVRRVDGTNNLAYYQARGFNALGELLGVNFGNGVVTTNQYFAVSKRLQKVVTFKGGTTLQSLSYTFDKASNLKSITDGAYTGAASAALSDLQYDDLHRLTSLTRPAVSQTVGFSYNSIGNLTANGELGADAYVYPTGTVLPHAVKQIGTNRYAYDTCGNLTSRAGQRLDFDAENRLSSLRGTNGIVTFGYDAQGTRLWKRGTNALQVWHWRSHMTNRRRA